MQQICKAPSLCNIYSSSWRSVDKKITAVFFFRNVFLPASSLHSCPYIFIPHNVVLTTSRYTRNLSVCPCPDRRYFDHFFLDQSKTKTLHSAIYSFFHFVKFQNPRSKGLHTQVPRTKCCLIIPEYLKFIQVQTPIISTFLVDQTEASTLHICNIYSFTGWSFRTQGQRLHTKVPRTKCCINIPKYPKFV